MTVLFFKLFAHHRVKIKAHVCVCIMNLLVFFCKKSKFVLAPDNCTCQPGYNGSVCQDRTLLIF